MMEKEEGEMEKGQEQTHQAQCARNSRAAVEGETTVSGCQQAKLVAAGREMSSNVEMRGAA